MSISDCDCASGYELVGSQCKGCPIDQYRDRQKHKTCISCPEDFTTLHIGTKTSDDCVCKPTKYYESSTLGGDNIDGTCRECPPNHYCPGGWEKSTTDVHATAKPCPHGSRLDNDGYLPLIHSFVNTSFAILLIAIISTQLTQVFLFLQHQGRCLR